jgi:hypothetical protein
MALKRVIIRMVALTEFKGTRPISEKGSECLGEPKVESLLLKDALD